MKNLIKYRTSLLWITALLLLGGCSKEGDPTPSDLIVGNWKVGSANLTIKVGTQTLMDYLISQGLTTSEAQLIVSGFSGAYNISGNLDIKKGGTYSSTGGGSTTTGTWELTSDGKTLTIDKGKTNEFVYKVASLTATSLNLTADISETDSGVTYTFHLEVGLTK